MFAADRGWVAAHHRGDAQRSDRRGGGAKGPRGDPRAHDAGERPLSARAAGRSRGPRQPPAAPPRGHAPGAAGQICRPNSSWSRARWGRPSSSITPRRRIKGLVLEEGSPTAHVAIVARAFDIPVVGRVAGATSRIEAGDIVVVDGDHAQVLIRPSEDIQQSVAAAIETRTRRRAHHDTLRVRPVDHPRRHCDQAAAQCRAVVRSRAIRRRPAPKGSASFAPSCR